MVAWYWLLLAFSVGGSLGFCMAGIMFGSSLDNRADQEGHANWATAPVKHPRSPVAT